MGRGNDSQGHDPGWSLDALADPRFHNPESVNKTVGRINVMYAKGFIAMRAFCARA